MKKRTLWITICKTAVLSIVVIGILSAFAPAAFSQLFSSESIKAKSDTIRKVKKRYKNREIVVKFKDGVADNMIQALGSQHNTSVLSRHQNGKCRRMRFEQGRDMSDVLALYRANPNVEYAEPNYTVTAAMVPGDTYYSYQWHLDNPEYTGINMEAAWEISTGSPDVIVAVLDTGVAYENYGVYTIAPDLEQTTFVQGYDVVNQDDHPNDDNGHGTHVTGTIAQSSNNRLGTAGVAFNVSIMPVKVLDEDGEGSHVDVADGIYWAVDNGAKIINLSLGSEEDSNTLEDACAYAHKHGVTIIASAGNDGNDYALTYPAAYDDYVISVGATRYDGQRTYYSNGGTYLDLMAPGGDLTVDQNNDGYPDGILQQTFSGHPCNFGYWFYSGTSMAAPHVTGVAALLLSESELLPGQVKETLEMTARDMGDSGWDSDTGWGLVDAAAALDYVVYPVHDVCILSVSAPAVAALDDVVHIDVTISNIGNYDETALVDVIDSTGSISLGAQSAALETGNSTVLSFEWNTADLKENTYDLTASVLTDSEDANADNDQAALSITLKAPVHDVSVAALDVAIDASAGEIVPVSVTLENQGTYDETLKLVLTDTMDGAILASQSLDLDAGASRVYAFEWDTTGLDQGEHTVEASVAAVSGETELSDNTALQTIVITEPVTNIEINTVNISQARGEYIIRAYFENKGDASETATAQCVILDENALAIIDDSFSDLEFTLPRNQTGVAKWTAGSLTPGTYTARVSLAGYANVTKDTVFIISGRPGSFWPGSRR